MSCSGSVQLCLRVPIKSLEFAHAWCAKLGGLAGQPNFRGMFFRLQYHAHSVSRRNVSFGARGYGWRGWHASAMCNQAMPPDVSSCVLKR